MRNGSSTWYPFLDVALYLLGDDRPCELSAFRATLRDVSTGIADDRENLASVTLRTKSGAIVHLQFNFASDDHSADAWCVHRDRK